jgi:hypothetical protein
MRRRHCLWTPEGDVKRDLKRLHGYTTGVTHWSVFESCQGKRQKELHSSAALYLYNYIH